MTASPLKPAASALAVFSILLASLSQSVCLAEVLQNPNQIARHGYIKTPEGGRRQAREIVDVVTATAPDGETRHLATGTIECRLWEQCGIAYAQTGSGFNRKHHWMCSFDDPYVSRTFGGYDDKMVVGVGDEDIKEFLRINGAESGKTILVLSELAVLNDKVVVEYDQVVGLEEYIPEEKKASGTKASATKASATKARIEAPRLKFPEPKVNQKAPKPEIGAEDPNQKVPKPEIGAEDPNQKVQQPEIGAQDPNQKVQQPEIAARAPNLRASKPEIAAQAPEPLGTRHRGLVSSTGTVNTIVVRVNALDNVPPPAVDLSEDIFNDDYCLKSQYGRCSFNKMIIEEYNPGNGISNVPTAAPGVVDVFVDVNAQGTNYEELQALANIALREMFGGSDPGSLFDLVMFCMPPGSLDDDGEPDWLAYAYVNRWDSYYNNDWCQSMSAQMHEVGHNLGLQHSGEYVGDDANQEYGDQSGYMSFSFINDDVPAMCFNPAKSWQLGWYADKQIDIDPNAELSNEPTSYILNGVIDYDDTTAERYVVIKIGNYYLGFNRQASFNVGTQEAPNSVTVTQKLGTPESSTFSKRVAILNTGNEYVIEFSAIRIKVRYVQIDDSKDAIIELNLEGEPEVCQGEFDAEIVVDLVTDNYPTETSWGIVNNVGQYVFISGEYNVRGATSTETVRDLCKGLQYSLIIDDSFGDGICCSQGTGSITGTYNDLVLFSGGEFGSQLLIPFVIPLDSTSSPPTAAPTANPTANPTSSPTANPTVAPTANPTTAPTSGPTAGPTANPTVAPTANPTAAPTSGPTANPTANPTAAPTSNPTTAPTSGPTANPTANPTAAPTSNPTAAPTSGPTAGPAANPTAAPTSNPTAVPTSGPTPGPTANPTAAPTANPTAAPTSGPTAPPTRNPTAAPTANPTDAPTGRPTAAPTLSPTAFPTSSPTASPVSPTAPGSCVDDADWLYRSKANKDCAWIARKGTRKRIAFCGKKANKGSDPTQVWFYCKETCDNVVGFSQACP